jgi:hypothetical protein
MPGGIKYVDVVYRDSGSSNTVKDGTGVFHPSDGDARAVEQISGTIASFANKYIQSTAQRAAVRFSNELITQSRAIVDAHRGDPDGYERDYDAMLSTLLKSVKNSPYEDTLRNYADRRKRVAMLSIGNDALNKQRKDTINDLRTSANGVLGAIGTSAALLPLGDEFKQLGIGDLTDNFAGIVHSFNMVDGDGHRLIADNEAADYVQAYNSNVALGTLRAYLNSCTDLGEIDTLVDRLKKGDISAPRYAINENTRVAQVANDVPLDIQDPAMGESYGEEIMRARDRIIRSDVLAAQTRALNSAGASGSAGGMLRNSTQPSIDRYFDEHSKEFLSGDRSARLRLAGTLARMSDGVPSQVKGAIVASVRSGDPDAITLSAIFLDAWMHSNPYALGRAFIGEEDTLVRAFSLANTLSPAGTTDKDVRNKSLASINDSMSGRGHGRDSDIDARVDGIIAEMCSDEKLTDMVMRWSTNGHRPPINNLWTLEDSDVPFAPSLSDMFLADMREHFRSLLESSGMDVSAAMKVLHTHIAQYCFSDFNTLLGVTRGTLMRYAPECYPHMVANRRVIKRYMDRAGEQYLSILKDSGDLADGAKYLGSELLPSPYTDREDTIIRQAMADGVDHVRRDDGEKIYSPTYLHVVHYDDGGIYRSDIIGLFNPSELLNGGTVTDDGGITSADGGTASADGTTGENDNGQ